MDGETNDPPEWRAALDPQYRDMGEGSIESQRELIQVVRILRHNLSTMAAAQTGQAHMTRAAISEAREASARANEATQELVGLRATLVGDETRGRFNDGGAVGRLETGQTNTTKLLARIQWLMLGGMVAVIGDLVVHAVH